jgi:hypothetical protein
MVLIGETSGGGNLGQWQFAVALGRPPCRRQTS